MDWTYEGEQLFSNAIKTEEIFDPEEDQTPLTIGNGGSVFVKEEVVDYSSVKEEVEDGEMLGYGGYTTGEEAEFAGNQPSRKRKWSPGVEVNNYVVKQNLREEVESLAAFNAHLFLSNEDLIEGDVQDDGVRDFDDMNVGKEDKPMDNVDLMCPAAGCFMKLVSGDELIEHMKTHSAPLCRFCKNPCAIGCLFGVHSATAEEKPFKCDFCEGAFAHKGSLYHHLRVIHAELPYKCDDCDYKASDYASLRRHKLTHIGTHIGEKSYQCIICEKHFARSSILNKHMRIHTGERPYACDVCEYKSATRSALKVHGRTHTGEKPYCCTTCGYESAQSGNLLKHKVRFAH